MCVCVCVCVCKYRYVLSVINSIFHFFSDEEQCLLFCCRHDNIAIHRWNPCNQ